jgi:hypothetical protein
MPELIVRYTLLGSYNTTYGCHDGHISEVFLSHVQCINTGIKVGLHTKLAAISARLYPFSARCEDDWTRIDGRTEPPSGGNCNI